MILNMKTSGAFTLVVLSMGLILPSACKTHDGMSGQKSEDTMPMGTFNSLAESKFGIVCGLLMSNEDPSCKSAVIQATCAQSKNSLTEAIKSLMADPSLRDIASDQEKYNKINESIRSDFFMAVNGKDSAGAGEKFTSAADRCLNAQKYKEAEEFDALAQTPEFKERAVSVRSAFWKDIAIQATTEVVRQGITRGVGYLIGKVASPKTAIGISQLFYSSLCAGGFQFAAGFAQSNAQQSTGDECAALKPSDYQKLWSKECMNVYAGACSAAMGTVELRNLGLESDSEVANFVLDTANTGLWSLCNAGGPTIRVSCGAINYSANQIGMALKTGNNDLATCTGVAKLGACVGKRWGEAGWSNNSGVEVSRVEIDRRGNKWPVTGCCACQKKWYRSARFAIDPLTATDNWMGVIQKGDFASGNCAQQEGKRGKYDESNYYIYSQCQRVDIVGASCSLQEFGGNDKPYDVTRILWDQRNKAPNGVIKRRN